MASSFWALVLLVGSVLAGECGPLGPECHLAVSRTIANRLADDRWSGEIDEVLAGYLARGDATGDSLIWAYVLVTRPESLSDGRWYYAYSDADRARMGWAAGDATVCGHGLCVHLSERWMGR